MKARVDADACIGCGLCADMCPAVFEMNDGTIAVVRVDPVPVDAQGECREAAENCPVEAIEITE